MIFLKEGFITEKSGAPTEAELEKINRLSRRILKADEVFVFSVVLCDNDVDRDFERFSEQSLKTLAALYIGKTGIFDHSCKGRDQVARIFDTQVEYPDGQQTKTGERYCRLKARAYMPKSTPESKKRSAWDVPSQRRFARCAARISGKAHAATERAVFTARGRTGLFAITVSSSPPTPMNGALWPSRRSQRPASQRAFPKGKEVNK